MGPLKRPGLYLVLGVAFAAFFWLLESLLHALIFNDMPFIQALYDSSVNEIWMRSVIAFLFIMFGVVGFVVGRRMSRLVQQITVDKRAFEEMTEAIVITDRNNRIVYVNPAYSETTGYRKRDVIGKNPSLSSSGKQDASFYKAMRHQIAHAGHWEGEVWNRHKTGELYPEWLSVSAITNEQGEVDYYVGVFTDISERKKAETVIRHYAFYDPLTDLPNRRFFEEQVGQAILFAERSHTKLALLFLDMDKFKSINDQYGHNVGDQYLCAYADALQASLRKVDVLSRFGGDEFVILLTSLEDGQYAMRVAEKILAIKRVWVEQQELEVSCSIGMAIYPDDAQTMHGLIEKSDTAMYRVKNKGKAAAGFYAE